MKLRKSIAIGVAAAAAVTVGLAFDWNAINSDLDSSATAMCGSDGACLASYWDDNFNDWAPYLASMNAELYGRVVIGQCRIPEYVSMCEAMATDIYALTKVVDHIQEQQAIWN